MDKWDEYRSAEAIQKEMMDKIDDTYDKSQSSLLHVALAPTSVQIADLSSRMIQTRKSLNIEDATGEYLTHLCKDRGVDREPAKYTILEVRFWRGEKVYRASTGEKFTSGGKMYMVTFENQLMGQLPTYELKALEPEHAPLGDTWFCHGPLKDINVEVLKVLQYGAPEESDSELRERYFELSRKNAYAGNRGWYQNEVRKIAPVHAVRVVRNKGKWKDHNVEIYIYGLNDSTSLKYVQKKLEEKAPVMHTPKVLPFKEDKGCSLFLELEVLPNADRTVIGDMIKESVNQFCIEECEKVGEGETCTITTSSLIAYLENASLPLLSIVECTLNGKQKYVFDYDYLPFITNIQLSFVEGV